MIGWVRRLFRLDADSYQHRERGRVSVAAEKEVSGILTDLRNAVRALDRDATCAVAGAFKLVQRGPSAELKSPYERGTDDSGPLV